MKDEEKAKELGKRYCTPCHGIGDCEYEATQAALEMAEWKDEQYLETAQEDAEDYVKGVAKANPDLSVSILNLLETAYIAGRNRI